jgi:hypothetical protein
MSLKIIHEYANQTSLDFLGLTLDNLWDWGVTTYVRPKHVGHVFASCTSFFAMSKYSFRF